MIQKNSIAFKITDSPDNVEHLVATAEQINRVHWMVGRASYTPNDYDSVKLSLVRKVWHQVYGDVREDLISVMNMLRNVPDPDYNVSTALSKIEETLGKLNLPHSSDFE